ncbi:UNVERIFIED_CONTAM: hypothetical protein GTU68_008822 [Idotea baltica]|nr:hypothetical protein [Idotea baltica]
MQLRLNLNYGKHFRKSSWRKENLDVNIVLEIILLTFTVLKRN